MTSVGRHNGPRTKLSALEELQSIGGSLSYWKFFKESFESLWYRNKLITVEKNVAKKIIADTQHLISLLKKVGLDEFKEPLFVTLENLKEIFSEENPARHLYREEKERIAIAEYFYYPGRIKAEPKQVIASKGGRPIDSLGLYFLVPGLIIYTAYISKNCTPKWDLVRRLLHEELGIKDSSLQRWWHENVGLETPGELMSQKERIILHSCESYLEWIGADDDDFLHRYYAVGGPQMNKEEKRYFAITLKLCPFLKKKFAKPKPVVFRSIKNERRQPKATAKRIT